MSNEETNMGAIDASEFDRYKRFQAEQYKEIALQIMELKKLVGASTVNPLISNKTQDFLAKQIDILLKKVNFLEIEVGKLRKEIENQGKK